MSAAAEFEYAVISNLTATESFETQAKLFGLATDLMVAIDMNTDCAKNIMHEVKKNFPGIERTLQWKDAIRAFDLSEEELLKGE